MHRKFVSSNSRILTCLATCPSTCTTVSAREGGKRSCYRELKEKLVHEGVKQTLQVPPCDLHRPVIDFSHVSRPAPTSTVLLARSSTVGRSVM